MPFRITWERDRPITRFHAERETVTGMSTYPTRKSAERQAERFRAVNRDNDYRVEQNGEQT